MANEILPKEEVIDNYYNQNERYILNNRLKLFQELLNSFNSNVPEAEILFGKQLATVCKDINGIMFKYSMCLNEYLQLVGNTNNLDHLASVKKNIYNFSAQDNLKEEFDIAINKIELLVSKHLSLKAK